MRDIKQVVAIIASFLASLIGTLFVMGYSSIKSRNLCLEGFSSPDDWPSPARFYRAFGPWGLLVPAAMALFAVFLMRKDRFSDLVVAVYTAAGWLFALSWSLGCIITWELPWALIGGVVK
jgi:hypothetical protein